MHYSAQQRIAEHRLGSMKYEEQIASAYLETLGLGPARYEPDGNVPPDFVLSNLTAVEVQRLNKHVEISGRHVGLEQAEIPLMRAIEATARKFDRVWSGKTYYVFARFRRPLPDRKTLAPKLENALQAFLQGSMASATAISVDPALSIDVVPATPKHGRCFLIGGNSDSDRGGWVVEDYRTNIQLCSDEKLAKVAPYRAKYHHWWLVLVDFIGYGLDENDCEQLGTAPPVVHRWDKLVVISPLHPHVFEI